MNNVISINPPPEPHYLRENWKRLMAFTDDEDTYHLIRVRNRVGSILSSGMILRVPILEDAPDGLYSLGSANQLIRRDIALDELFPKNKYGAGLRYPDIELLKPNTDRLQVCCNLELNQVGTFITWLTKVCETGRRVAIDMEGAWNPEMTEFEYRFPFNLREDVQVSSKYLRVAMIEMTRYSGVSIFREPDRAGRTAKQPLIIGKNWDSCAVIFPNRFT